MIGSSWLRVGSYSSSSWSPGMGIFFEIVDFCVLNVGQKVLKIAFFLMIM